MHEIHSPDIPEIPERVEFWLYRWAHWMRAKPSQLAELGFPGRAKPFISGGESRRGPEYFEDTEIETLQYGCETMNALIDSLPPAQRCAICHVYAGDAYKFPRDNMFELLEKAAHTLLIGMNKWVVL